MEFGLIRNVLWSYFKEYVKNTELSGKRDENNKLDTMESIEYLLKAEKAKKNIELIWGLNEDLLTGVFIYLDSKDSYFNPRLNTQDSFFDKICIFNKKKLEKIGKRNVKPKYPFVSFENMIKKLYYLDKLFWNFYFNILLLKKKRLFC